MKLSPPSKERWKSLRSKGFPWTDCGEFETRVGWVGPGLEGCSRLYTAAVNPLLLHRLKKGRKKKAFGSVFFPLFRRGFPPGPAAGNFSRGFLFRPQSAFPPNGPPRRKSPLETSVYIDVVAIAHSPTPPVKSCGGERGMRRDTRSNPSPKTYPKKKNARYGFHSCGKEKAWN